MSALDYMAKLEAAGHSPVSGFPESSLSISPPMKGDMGLNLIVSNMSYDADSGAEPAPTSDPNFSPGLC